MTMDASISQLSSGSAMRMKRTMMEDYYFDLRIHAFSRFALPDTNPTQRELSKILEIQGCLSAVDMSKDPPLVVVLKMKAAAAADDNNNNTGTGVAWSMKEFITLPSHQYAMYSTNHEFTLWTVLCRV
jgi:hypothetical protein